MRWNELENEWQKVFELCWEAYCEGNLPIAAVIADKDGNILSTGRNNYHISEKFLNSKVDHAETECVQMLDVKKYPYVKEYILFTSMEPCPMCMGTIVIGNLRKVRIAARDPWAGSTDICNKNEYIAGKNMDIKFEDESYGMVSMAFQAYAELRSGRIDNQVLKRFELDYPKAILAAKIMHQDRVLDLFADEKKSIEEVFDHVCRILDAVPI